MDLGQLYPWLTCVIVLAVTGLIAFTFIVITISALTVRRLDIHVSGLKQIADHVGEFRAKSGNVFRRLGKRVVIPSPSPKIQMPVMVFDCEHIFGRNNDGISPTGSFWADKHPEGLGILGIIWESEIVWQWITEPFNAGMRDHILRRRVPPIFPHEGNSHSAVRFVRGISQSSSVKICNEDKRPLDIQKGIPRDLISFFAVCYRVLRSPHLVNIDNQKTDASEKSDPFTKSLPPWSVIWSASGLSFGIFWLGWHSIRNGRQGWLPVTACIIGAIVWMWSFSFICQP
ncbi:MAG: hypothetical protein ABSG07_13670 [Terriglobales bacterium]|jgi:hypothetical protein